jgi:hypothetical protein
VNASQTKRERRPEAGVVLLIAIFVLMLVSIVAIALILSAGTETALTANYRSSATAYYAALAGLEEARGRLQLNNPDYFNNAQPGFMPPPGTPLALGSVRYIVNPSGGEIVDPRDSSSPYFDNEYQSEFGMPITAAPDVLPPINSISGNNAGGIPGPVFKWVRINAVTKTSLKINVDGLGLNNTLLYYDPQHKDSGGASKPSLVVSNSSVTAVQAFEVTSLAVLPNGSRKLLQYVVAQNSLSLQFPAALTLVGNSVQFVPPTDSSNFNANGDDQFDVGACHHGPSAVYGLGYANASDGSTVTSAIVPPYPSHYVGYGGTVPNVGWIGNSTSPPPNLSLNEMKPSGLESLVQQLALVPNATVITPGSGLAAHPHDLPATSPNPKTIVVNGDLDTTTEAPGASQWAGGHGILVVTGKLTYKSLDPFGAPARWQGIILVIGQGQFVLPFSGSGEIDGALLIAKTRNAAGAILPDAGTGTPDAGLGAATFAASAGGMNGIFYSSCWIQAVLPPSNYKVLSFREIPQ